MKSVNRRTLGVLSIVMFTAGLVLPLILLTLYNQLEKPREVPTTQPGLPGQQGLVSLSYKDLVDTITKRALVIHGVKALLTPIIGAELPVDVPLVIQSISTETGELVIMPVSAVKPIPTSRVAPKTIEYSTTNVQVAGVDEHDIVKTNGRVIAIARGEDVVIIDATNNTVASYIDIPGVRGLYLVNNTLVLIREVSVASTQLTPVIDIFLYDVSNPGEPRLVERVNVTSSLAGSRLVNNYLYIVGFMNSYEIKSSEDRVVVSVQIPHVNGESLPAENIFLSEDCETYIVILALDISSGEYSVKSYLGGVVEWIYMVPDRLYIAWRSPLTMYAVSLKVLEYMVSQGYLTQEEFEGYEQMIIEGRGAEVRSRISVKIQRHPEYLNLSLGYIDETTFLVLDIRGLEVSSRGLFKVPGEVLDQFAMEEYCVGESRFMVIATTLSKYRLYLWMWRPYMTTIHIMIIKGGEEERVTLTTIIGEDSENITGEHVLWLVNIIPEDTSNNVYIVDENLNIVAELVNLAQGERIFAARLIKNILYLVTFRAVDPLFAIDLSNPYQPRVLGYLKIPGFSEYLHPLSENILLGIGLEDWSLKISLFDVSDPANMSEVAKLKIGVFSDSEVLRDHKAFTVDPRYEYFVIPVTAFTTTEDKVAEGFIVVKYSLEDNTLTLLKIIDLEKPLRALYTGNTLYLVGYSKTLILEIPEFTLRGEITY